MEYKKIINFVENTPNQPSKFGTKFGLKYMMNHVEHIMLTSKSNLKLQC